ncbi:MAG: PAS domain-containing protein, partial [Pseudomonadota bacterium]
MSISKSYEDAAWPAWIWDPLRRRVIWANGAAVRLWDVESPADLYDLTFRPSDPVSRDFDSLFAELNNRGAKPDTDEAPLTSEDGSLDARLIAIAGGRTGLFITVNTPPRQEGEQILDRMTRLYRLLGLEAPVPLILFDQSGRFVTQNREAELVLGDNPLSLAGLVSDPQLADRILARAGEQGVAGRSVHLNTVYGRSLHRLTLRKYETYHNGAQDDAGFGGGGGVGGHPKTAHSNGQPVDAGDLEPLFLAHFRDLHSPDELEGSEFAAQDAGQLPLPLRRTAPPHPRPTAPPAPAPSRSTEPDRLNGAGHADPPPGLLPIGTLPYGLLVLDRHLRIKQANPMAQRIFARASREVETGMPAADLFSDTDREAVLALFKKLSHASEPSQNGDAGGRQAYVSVLDEGVACELRAVQWDEAGDVYLGLALLDLSAWFKREHQLVRARRKAEETTRRRAEFLAMISHE